MIDQVTGMILSGTEQELSEKCVYHNNIALWIGI